MEWRRELTILVDFTHAQSKLCKHYLAEPGPSILRGLGEQSPTFSKVGGWRIGHLDYIFLLDLLVVALGIPVMPIVNRDYLKLVLLYVCVNSTGLQLSTVEILTTALRCPNHARPKSKIMPQYSAQTRWSCFTVSDVGVDLPSIVGGG